MTSPDRQRSMEVKKYGARNTAELVKKVMSGY